MEKSVKTLREEAWANLKKIADKLLEAGDKSAATLVIDTAMAIARMD